MSYVLRIQDVAMAVAAGALLLAWFFAGTKLTAGGLVGMWLLAYGALATFSVPTSIWLGESVKAVRELAKLLLIFFVTINVVTTRERARWLVAALVILAVIYPGFGALEYYLRGLTKEVGRANWRGVFGNSNMTALAMLMYAPFAAALLVGSRRWAAKWGWGAAIVLFLSVAVLTKSRAGFLALAALALGGIALSRHRVRATIVVGLLAVGTGVLGPQDFKTRIATLTRSQDELDGSARSRKIIWGTAVEIALSRPVTGVGLGTYAQANANVAPEELGTSGGDRWMDTHNTFLNIWAEIGTPGALAFCGMIAVLLLRVVRTIRVVPKRDPLASLLRASVAAMIVFLVMALFNTFHTTWFFFVTLGIPVAIMRIVQLERMAASYPIVSETTASPSVRGGARRAIAATAFPRT